MLQMFENVVYWFCLKSRSAHFHLKKASFGIYNTEEEVDQLLEMLPSLIEQAKYEVDTQYSRADPAY